MKHPTQKRGNVPERSRRTHRRISKFSRSSIHYFLRKSEIDTNPDILKYVRWLEPLIDTSKESMLKAEDMETLRKSRSETREIQRCLKIIQKGIHDEPQELLLDVRLILALGACMWKTPNEEISKDIPAFFLEDITASALLPFIVIPTRHLPKHWKEGLEEIASPQLVELVARLKRKYKRVSKKSRILLLNDLLEYLAQSDQREGVCNIIRDLSDSSRSGRIIRIIIKTRSKYFPSEESHYKALIAFIMGLSGWFTITAIEGVIGNRVDEIVTNLWKSLVNTRLPNINSSNNNQITPSQPIQQSREGKISRRSFLLVLGSNSTAKSGNRNRSKPIYSNSMVELRNLDPNINEVEIQYYESSTGQEFWKDTYFLAGYGQRLIRAIYDPSKEGLAMCTITSTRPVSAIYLVKVSLYPKTINLYPCKVRFKPHHDKHFNLEALASVANICRRTLTRTTLQADVHSRIENDHVILDKDHILHLTQSNQLGPTVLIAISLQFQIIIPGEVLNRSAEVMHTGTKQLVTTAKTLYDFIRVKCK